MSSWSEALGWGHQQIDALRYVGYCYLKQGLYDTALAFFNALIILDPKNPYDWQTLGALYLQTDQAQKALETLDTALQFDPLHEPTKLNRAKALFMLGYKEQGLSQAAEVVKVSNKDLADQALALVLSQKK